MELLRSWILGVTITAMALAAARAVMPEGPVKRAGQLTAGLVLVLAMLGPVAALEHTDWEAFLEELPTETASEPADSSMQAVIEQELAAYLEGKAGELGLSCRAEVVCNTDEHGVPIPREVIITGTLDDLQRKSLSAIITNDIGVPTSGQRFREG